MKTIVYLVCYFLYPFSFLFVRKRNRYVFGSFRKSFNDNAKYLFIYTSLNRENIDAIWLSLSKETVRQVRKMGLKAYKTTSPKGIWYALTARYWFFNAYTSDIMFCLSGGATCINLWHGVGIKRIEYNITSGPLAKRYRKEDWRDVFLHPESFRKPDYVASSSPFQNKFFSSSFRIPEEHCLMVGYPRNMILVTTEEQRRDFIAKYEPSETAQMAEKMKGYNRVLVYMPTWRDSQLSLFAESMDLPKLNKVLNLNNELLIMKPHANVSAVLPQSSFSNIVFFNNTMDIYPLLPYTHVLITDYSSIIYDYLLMPEKDVILYIYDYDEYVAMRDFYFPYDENVVGKRVKTFDELLNCIDIHDYHLDDVDRQRIVQKFWGDTAGKDSSLLLLDTIPQLK